MPLKGGCLHRYQGLGFVFYNILSYACLALLLLDARVLPPHMLRPLCVPRPITKIILNQLVISVL